MPFARRLLTVILFTALLWMGMLPPAPLLAKETVVISTGEWAPWCGSKLHNKGAILDIVTRAFARRGYNTQFKFYVWRRAFKLMAAGDVQASAYWYHREKYEKVALFSEPLNTEEHVFIHLKSTHIRPWKTLTDLKGYRIGATGGFSYSDEFWRLAKEKVLTVEVVQNDDLNMKKLLAGRIDMFPTTRRVGYNVLTRGKYQHESDRVTITEQVYRRATGHLLFPKNRPESEKLLTEFNAGLREIIQDGTVENIMRKLEGGYYDPR